MQNIPKNKLQEGRERGARKNHERALKEAPRMMSFHRAVADSIERRLKVLGLTRAEAAVALDMCASSMYDTGEGGGLATRNLVKVAGTLGINLTEILGMLDFAPERAALAKAIEEKNGTIEDQIREQEARLKALREQQQMQKRVLQQVPG